MLDELDERLTIKDTETAGRGVFAKESIPGDALILQASPFCQVILYQFRKEVCAYCFKYELGRSWKFKIEGSGLWFCSNVCLEAWSNFDDSESILEALKSVEKFRASKKRKLRRIGSRRPIHDVHDTVDLPQLESESFTEEDVIEYCWSTLPSAYEFKEDDIDEYDMDQIKFIAMATARRDNPGWNEMLKLQSSEMSFFRQCKTQSKEAMTLSIPTAFLHQIHLFSLFHKITSLSSDLFRAVLYRDIGNSFGIHEEPMHPDSEFLGWALYPSASFFNHACWPVANVSKKRIGRLMEFRVGSIPLRTCHQATISYGGDEGAQRHDGEDGNARRARIKEGWMFDCLCDRCLKEMI